MLISESKWTRLFTKTTGCNITHMCQFGSDYIAHKLKVTSYPFWKETISYIFKLISTCGLSQDDILLEPLWYNYKNECHYYGIWPPAYLHFAKFCVFSRKLHVIFCIVCSFMLHNLHRTYIPH